MAQITVNIAVSDAALGRLDEIASDLAAAGVVITQRLEAIGVFTGTVDEQQLRHVRAIGGIGAVTPSGRVSIADRSSHP